MTQQASVSAGDVLAVIREVDAELTAAVKAMSDAEIEGASYASDWSVAQVMSHLGSSSEIFGLALAAVKDGTPPPGPEALPPIWEVWNAKSPAEQVSDGIAAITAFTDKVGELSQEEQAAWHAVLLGDDRDLADVLLMRLAEEAVHAWDVLVMLEPAATIAPAAVDLITDWLGMIVQATAQPPAEPIDATVFTTSPSRQFQLRAGDGAVTLRASDQIAGATLMLPAEAFIRLVYGRLDDDHTGDVTANGVTLNALRAIFPGF